MKTRIRLPKNRKKLKRRPRSNNALKLSDEELKDFIGIRDNFILAIEKYGANERGEAIKLPGWYRELSMAIADFRIAVVYTTGCSQLGKTLVHTNLVCYCMEQLGLNPLWSYDLQTVLNIQVPSNFRPVAEHWLKKAGKQSSKGAKNNTIYQVGSATTQFTYVSTSDTGKNKSGRAAAGGIAVGVSRDILFKEERSQYPLGAADPLRRRLDAGRIITKPERELGTPGGGAGIEAEIEKADCYFYPHFVCNNCGERSPLHPKGSLLKKFDSDHPILGKKEAYLSESGRPVKWFHHDANNPVNTAYFGCPHCEAEISKEAREQAYYQCLYTHITLEDYLNQLPKKELPSQRYKVGICISPLLRIEVTNTAAEIIEEGLDTVNTADWQQQRLGLPSEQGTNKITIDMIKATIGLPVPSRKPDFVLGGVDCGRGGHWLTKVEYYLPKDYRKLKLNAILDSTIRHIVYANLIDKNSLKNAVRNFDYGIIDNEPERDWATRFCASTKFEMADQKPGLKNVVQLTKVVDGGVYSPCWNIRNEKFQAAVLNGFLLQAEDGYLLYRFPESFSQYLGNLKSDRNPFRHIMALTQDPETKRFIRPDDHCDDIYFSLMFNEVAFYIYLMNTGKNQRIGTWKFS